MSRLTDEEEADLEKLVGVGKSGDFKRVGPLNFVVPRSFNEDEIRRFEVFEDDVWIVTPPKCGTTWTQEIVWLLRNDVDVEGVKANQFYRAPFMDIQYIWALRGEGPPYPEDLPKTNENLHSYLHNSIEYTRRLARPRIAKSHNPISLMPENLVDKCKVIFVSRNVKDMAISYYYHYKTLFRKEQLDLPLFLKLFKSNVLLHTPMIPMVLEAWNMRNHKNLLFLTYEELKADIDSCIAKIADFIGAPIPAGEKMAALKKHIKFDNLKNNDAVNKSDEIGPGFIRKGIVGDWRNHFDEETNREWDEWIQREMKGSDFKMVFE